MAEVKQIRKVPVRINPYFSGQGKVLAALDDESPFNPNIGVFRKVHLTPEQQAAYHRLAKSFLETTPSETVHQGTFENFLARTGMWKSFIKDPNQQKLADPSAWDALKALPAIKNPYVSKDPFTGERQFSGNSEGKKSPVVPRIGSVAQEQVEKTIVMSPFMKEALKRFQ